MINNPPVRRVALIVLDSVGIGALPDAAKYGDEGSNTVGHIAQKLSGFTLPNLQAMGLGNIDPAVNLPPAQDPSGAFGKAREVSPGKDTTTGHWEISGLILRQDFPYFPQGFPAHFMQELEQRIGRKTIGNKSASGTGIIDELGEEHVRTGYPIVYTSADSVFQVAMHEDVIPLEEQYHICKVAREMLTGELAVGRVIARPFLGKPGSFTRTPNRKDFSLLPPGKTILTLVQEAGLSTMAVGKIKDIFAEQSVSLHKKTADNMEGVDRTLDFLKSDERGLIFTNLVDFDMHFGHRRDVEGYGNCLREFDARLPELLTALREDDVLIITADHGNDPTHHGSDHTREHIPILVFGKKIRKGVHLGTRTSFADIGATIAEMLQTAPTQDGVSFASEILVNF